MKLLVLLPVLTIAWIMCVPNGGVARRARHASFRRRHAPSPWFRSLTIPNTGSSCCGTADCRNYPVVVASDGYRVQFKGQWLKVPPAVVQDRRDNPTGDYVTCIIDAAEPEVLCFIKAPGT